MGVDQEVQMEEATGRMVNLSCEAQGFPLPSISWNIVGSQVSSHSLTSGFICIRVGDAAEPCLPNSLHQQCLGRFYCYIFSSCLNTYNCFTTDAVIISDDL